VSWQAWKWPFHCKKKLNSSYHQWKIWPKRTKMTAVAGIWPAEYGYGFLPYCTAHIVGLPKPYIQKYGLFCDSQYIWYQSWKFSTLSISGFGHPYMDCICRWYTSDSGWIPSRSSPFCFFESNCFISCLFLLSSSFASLFCKCVCLHFMNSVLI